MAVGSPVFIGGRGLKLAGTVFRSNIQGGSPVFIGGRGLKHFGLDSDSINLVVRPSLLAGAD